MYFAITQALKDRGTFAVLFASAVIILILLIAIPILTIPGNTIQFQLKVFRMQDYILIIALSILAGLNFALNWYGFKLQKTVRAASGSAAGGVASGIAGVFGAIVGTATCASCLAALFGLIGLGTGSVFFVLKNQSYFLLGAIVLMLISLYFAARKINKVCTSC